MGFWNAVLRNFFNNTFKRGFKGMNTSFQKRQYNGFKLDNTLMSRVRWTAVLFIEEKGRRTIHREKQDVEYWTFKDEFGLSISCFNKDLAEKIYIGEKWEMAGEVKVGKGGIFLNLKTATVFNGREYEPEIEIVCIDGEEIEREV